MFIRMTLIANRIIPIAALCIIYVWVNVAYALLAKRANVADPSSPSGSDFSYESRYANRSDGIVNLFTGLPMVRKKLLNISSRSGISYDLNLVYNGAVQGQVKKYNLVDPTGYAGLGWNFTPEAIFVDAKGTVTASDDAYYYVQQSGEVSQIVRQGEGPYTYQVKNEPYWKIFPNAGGWTIVHTDGTCYNFGTSNNSRRYFEYGPGGFLDCTNENTFTFQWDLASISLANGAGAITFEYEVNTERRCPDMEFEPTPDKRYMCTKAQGGLLFYSGYYDKLDEREHRFEDDYDCIKNRDVACLADHADYYWLHTNLHSTAPELQGQSLNGWCILQEYDKWTIGYGDIWNLYLAKRFPIVEKIGGIYVEQSILKKIRSDNSQEIRLEFGQKDADEYATRILGVNDVFLKTVWLYENGVEKERLILSYSGESNQVRHANSGSQKAKRLLTGITSMMGSGVNNCTFQYSKDWASLGMLTIIAEPMTGKNTSFQYGTHEVRSQEGGLYVVPVVERLVESGGTTTAPDIVKTYSYSTSTLEQDYDASSGIAYWGKVTTSSAIAGNIVTTFDLDKTAHLFGVRKSVEKYSAGSNLVSSEVYTYSVKTFGPSGNEWYLPVLTKTTTSTDGVSAHSGTSACAIDPNSGMAKQSWKQNTDGKTLVTQRRYVYEESGHSNMANKNMLTQVAGTKLIEVSSFNPATCDVSSGKVVKASYTVWDDVSARPVAMYAWNYSKSTGLSVASFIDFNPANPTANGWQLTGTIDKYDNYGNVLQVSDSRGVSTSTIYGTSFWVPVATLTSSSFNECAVFTCAYDLNESEGSKSYYDKFNGWEKGVGLGSDPIDEVTSSKVHFGQKCIHVKNSYGPTKNISIDKNRDYIFSAWVYLAGTSGTARLTLELLRASGSKIGNWELETDDIAGFERNKWNLMELRIDHLKHGEHLISGTTSDIAKGRIYISSNPGEFYVDDIRFYPKTSLVSSTYFDEKWRAPIVSVDANNHLGPYTEYDTYGRPSKTYKLDKTKSNDAAGAKVLRMKKEYHLLGENMRLVSPNGGEQLVAGQQYCIAWSGPATIGNNGVDIYFNNGASWIKQTAAPLVNQNTYIWTVPRISATGCRIKVQSVDDSSVKDESDGTFNIHSRYLSNRFLPFKNQGFIRKELFGSLSR
jgi:hypothetical protein